MPFQSRAQEAACFAKKRRGQAKGWNCEEWAHETDQAHLPARKKKADVIAALGGYLLGPPYHHGEENGMKAATDRATGTTPARFAAYLGTLVVEQQALEKLASDSTLHVGTLAGLARKLGLPPGEFAKRAYADPRDFVTLLELASGQRPAAAIKEGGLSSMFARAQNLSQGRNFKPGGKADATEQNSVFSGAPKGLHKSPIRRSDNLQLPAGHNNTPFAGHSGRNHRQGAASNQAFGGAQAFQDMVQHASPGGQKTAQAANPSAEAGAHQRGVALVKAALLRRKQACSGAPMKVVTRREASASGKGMNATLKAMSQPGSSY